MSPSRERKSSHVSILLKNLKRRIRKKRSSAEKGRSPAYITFRIRYWLVRSAALYALVNLNSERIGSDGVGPLMI